MNRRTLFLLLVCAHVQSGLARLSLIKQRKSFFEAEVYCELHGGHLASVHNSVENEAVHQLCDSAHTDCWIGLTQGERGFQWTDGSQFGTYSNWHPGEPDNWNGVEKCVKIRSMYHDGTWSDQSCDADYSLSAFICSFPSDSHTQPTQSTTMMSTTETYTSIPVNAHKLLVDRDHAHFTLNGTRVFLSGINQAWVAYAYDFGASQYQYRRQQYERTIQQMAQSGGNSIRMLKSATQGWNIDKGIWVHVEGETSPLFDVQGFVTGTDKDNTLISDLRQYIRYAAQHNILVFITLWNAAVKQNYHYRIDGLIRDISKLQSYLEHALTPLVMGLKDEPGLGGWDIINEFEGQLKVDSVNSEPCFDTTFLKNSGAGWAGHLYTSQEYLRFINYQVAAIRGADPLAQVTAGAWSPDSVTDQMNWRNLYKDECLIKAGGKQMGTLTFYSMHSYDWNQHYAPEQPFLHNSSDYVLDKPLVVAEFNQKRGGGMKISEQFQWLYHRGYAGGWSWSYTDDSWSTQASGIASIRNYNNKAEGGKVAFHV